MYVCVYIYIYIYIHTHTHTHTHTPHGSTGRRREGVLLNGVSSDAGNRRLREGGAILAPLTFGS